MAGLLDFGTDEDRKQSLGLLGLLMGSGILAGNQPGASVGQAFGQGTAQGVQGLMQMKQQQAGQQLRDLQMQKLKADMEKQKQWQAMFGIQPPAAASAAGQPAMQYPPQPSEKMPDILTRPSPEGQPLRAMTPAEMADDGTPVSKVTLFNDGRSQVQGRPGSPGLPQGIPPNLMPFIGTLGPESGSKFMAEYLGKREPTEAWVDEEMNKVPGQRNKITNQWKPLDPTTTKVALNPNFNLSPGQTAEQKEVGEYYGKTYTQLQTDAMKARSQNAQLDNLAGLLDKTYTGTGGAAVLDLKKAAKAMGFDIDGVGEAEAGQALSRQMALELRNPAGGAGMPGAMSEGDRNFLESMTPGLSTTPQGRKQLVETYKKVNQRNMDVAKMARDYRKKHGQIDEGFFDDLQTFSDKNPLFKAGAKPPPRIRLDENGEVIQ